MMKAKAVTLTYYAGPWDGRSEKFETDVQFVDLPVYFNYELGQVCMGFVHKYLRDDESKALIYQGVFEV